VQKLIVAVVLGAVFAVGCGSSSEVGGACDSTADCDNPDPPPLHAECAFLSCIEGVCSKAGNEGVGCNGGTCNAEGECVDDSTQ
jgi:hypothetical protein